MTQATILPKKAKPQRYGYSPYARVESADDDAPKGMYVCRSVDIQGGSVWQPTNNSAKSQHRSDFAIGGGSPSRVPEYLFADILKGVQPDGSPRLNFTGR